MPPESGITNARRNVGREADDRGTAALYRSCTPCRNAFAITSLPRLLQHWVVERWELRVGKKNVVKHSFAKNQNGVGGAVDPYVGKTGAGNTRGFDDAGVAVAVAVAVPPGDQCRVLLYVFSAKA